MFTPTSLDAPALSREGSFLVHCRYNEQSTYKYQNVPKDVCMCRRDSFNGCMSILLEVLVFL